MVFVRFTPSVLCAGRFNSLSQFLGYIPRQEINFLPWADGWSVFYIIDNHIEVGRIMRVFPQIKNSTLFLLKSDS